jgi:hypothetical protein
VIEVELIEPSLFLDLAPGSAGRIAEELRRLAGGDAPAAGRR